MEKQQNDHSGSLGRLPALAPLANPYVPFQVENAPKYTPQRALIRGTLFPGLDLPFMGMANHEEKESTPLIDLQILSFALQELALYLDTHRDDAEALEMYRTYQKLYSEASLNYSENEAPMNHITPVSGAYRWPDDPWPWEYEQNKED